MALLRNLLFCVNGLLLLNCDGAAVEPVELTRVQSFMQDPEALVRGEALFLGTCAELCHVMTPEQNGALTLFDCEWRYGESDDELFAIITNGIPDTRMVGFGNNFPQGDDDKWKIIAFLRANQQPCG